MVFRIILFYILLFSELVLMTLWHIWQNSHTQENEKVLDFVDIAYLERFGSHLQKRKFASFEDN